MLVINSRQLGEKQIALRFGNKVGDQHIPTFDEPIAGDSVPGSIGIGDPQVGIEEQDYFPGGLGQQSVFVFAGTEGFLHLPAIVFNPCPLPHHIDRKNGDNNDDAQEN